MRVSFVPLWRVVVVVVWCCEFEKFHMRFGVVWVVGLVAKNQRGQS